MKHIKLYEEFSLDKVVSDEQINQLKAFSDSVKLYNQRKGNLQRLVFGNIDGKDISKNIEDIVKDNKFLKMYLGIVNLEMKLKVSEDNIKKMQDLISERGRDKQEASILDNADDKKKQLEKIDLDIKDYNNKILDIKKQITLLKPQIIKAEYELKNKITEEEGILKKLTHKNNLTI